MKKRFIYFVILFSILKGSVSAQEVILADTLTGCDSLEVQFTLDNARALADYVSVIWDFGDSTTAKGVLNPTHNYTTPGIYDVRCELDGGRVIIFDAQISVSITPYADFTFKDVNSEDNEFLYSFKSAYFKTINGINLYYTWRFQDVGSVPENDPWTEVQDSVPTFMFQSKGIKNVYLKIVDENGCSDSIIKKIAVSDSLMVPNVFTPNGDNINDYFKVSTPGDYNYYFKIFTPNGLEVFSSFSPVIFWDGHLSEGREAPEGVYYYIIQSDDMNPVKTSLTGFIHLFR
jgi:gliding motility-associated-like protein